MAKEKVSVIVPVYNTEEYLERCLESILNQTYKNIEVIVVNDGSPDKSQDIIDKYKKKDKRMIAINKKNEGVSIARNEGLKKASGDYILFVDSDDYIDKDYAEQFVNLIKKNNSDMAISYNCYDEGNWLPEASDYYRLIDGNTATEELYVTKMNVAVWNKIYKRKFIKDNNIIFDKKLWFAEGMTFNIECFQKTNKIATSYIKAYHQTPNPNSAVRKFNLESWHCGMRALEYQKTIIDMSSKKINNAWNYHYRKYYYDILMGIYMSHNEDIYMEEIKKCKRGLRHNIFYPFFVDISFRSKLVWVIIAINPMIMVRRKLKQQG